MGTNDMAQVTKFALMIAVLLVASIVRPAVAHTGATKMLKDAAIGHDLAQARRYFERIVAEPRPETSRDNKAPTLSR
jgi:hypothetical protein